MPIGLGGTGVTEGGTIMAGVNLTGVPSKADYLLGRARLQIASLLPSTDEPLSYRNFGNIKDIAISSEIERFKHFSTQQSTKTLDLEVILSQAANLKFTFEETLNYDNAAAFLNGTALAAQTNPWNATQAAFAWIKGTAYATGVAAGTYPGVIKGRWYDLTDAAGARPYDTNLGTTSGGVLTLQKGTNDPDGLPPVTVLVEGTDFTIDRDLGRVFFLTTGVVLANGDSVTASWTIPVPTRATVDIVRPFTGIIKPVAVKIISINAANSAAINEITLPKVSLAGEGDFGVLSDEIATMGMAGGILASNYPPFAAEPFGRLATHPVAFD